MSSHGGRGQGSLWSPSHKDSFHPKHFSTFPALKILSSLGVRFLTYKFQGWGEGTIYHSDHSTLIYATWVWKEAVKWMRAIVKFTLSWTDCFYDIIPPRDQSAILGQVECVRPLLSPWAPPGIFLLHYNYEWLHVVTWTERGMIINGFRTLRHRSLSCRIRKAMQTCWGGSWGWGEFKTQNGGRRGWVLAEALRSNAGIHAVVLPTHFPQEGSFPQEERSMGSMEEATLNLNRQVGLHGTMGGLWQRWESASWVSHYREHNWLKTSAAVLGNSQVHDSLASDWA